jgi:hypothetical protein
LCTRRDWGIIEKINLLSGYGIAGRTEKPKAMKKRSTYLNLTESRKWWESGR